MNIAFPLPFANLTSILRLEYRENHLMLTSLPGQRKGDEGVYLVTRLIPVRLPINETIRVWTADHAPFPPAHSATTLVARHDMWIFGLKFLTLKYHIYPKKS